MPAVTREQMTSRLNELRRKASAAHLTLEEQNEFAMRVSMLQEDLKAAEKELEIMREWLKK